MENKMKKLISILAVLALTAPCFASSVTITASASNDTLTIGYTNASGGVPVGVSMKVDITSGNGYVNAAGDVDPGSGDLHEVYIDWAYTNGTGSMDQNTGISTSTSAHPLALIGSAGPASLPTSPGADFELCMGELATPAGSIPTSGTLAVIKFSFGSPAVDTVIELKAGTSNRGGIVDENGDAMSVTWPTGSVTVRPPGCPTCIGDADGNNVINLTDVGTIVGWLNPLKPPTYLPPYTITKTNPPGAWAGKECGDADGNNVINLTDVGTIVGWLNPLKPPTYLPPYTKPCP
jgi:hypothetical protein